VQNLVFEAQKSLNARQQMRFWSTQSSFGVFCKQICAHLLLNEVYQPSTKLFSNQVQLRKTFSNEVQLQNQVTSAKMFVLDGRSRGSQKSLFPAHSVSIHPD
jgi:hypothetical protein